jgi:hypothetical protein
MFPKLWLYVNEIMEFNYVTSIAERARSPRHEPERAKLLWQIRLRIGIAAALPRPPHLPRMSGNNAP